MEDKYEQTNQTNEQQSEQQTETRERPGYTFCPRCGALLHNGVCPECGQNKPAGSGQMPYGEYSGGRYGQRWQSGMQPPNHQRHYGSFHPSGGSCSPNMHILITIGISVLTTLAVLFFVAFAYLIFKSGHILLSLEGSRPAAWQSGESMAPSGEALPSDGSQTPGEEGDGSSPLPDETDPSMDGQEAEEDYIPAPNDPYYKKLTNSINENVPYSFTMEDYKNSTDMVDVVTTYYQLQGDVPNLDSLNEHLKNAALYFATEFPEQAGLEGTGLSYKAYVTPYVTYNDESIVSIVYDQYVTVDNSYVVQLAPINIDVKNGVVLDNVGILSVDENFAADFVKRSEGQNGEIAFFRELTTGQLENLLTSANNLIIYYTPLGMEVGLNYGDGNTSGWVTVTYKDYEKYLAKF